MATYQNGLIPGLTADDWGMAPSINSGTLELAQIGIISRVSIMANTLFVKEGLKELLETPHVSLGLHFNVTYGRPVGDPALEQSLLWVDSLGRHRFYGPRTSLKKWLLKQISKNDLRRAFVTQMNALKSLSVPVTYFDSHHHIHLLPGFVSSIADLLHTCGISTIRVPYDSRLWTSKKAALNLLSLLKKRELKKLGFKWIPCLYPNQQDYENVSNLRSLLEGKNGYDIITHPASSEDFSKLEFPDIYTVQRFREYLSLKDLLLKDASEIHHDPAKRFRTLR